MKKDSERGFTLVELLVTVGLIAVLLALVLGSLSKVRQASEGTRCIANLRQAGAAFMNYVTEHGGKFPFNTHWHTAESTNPVRPGIRDYLGFPADLDLSRVDTFMTCPTLQANPRTRTRALEPFHRTYTLNLSATYGHNRYSLVNMLAIPRPASMILMFDGSISPGGSDDNHTYHVGHAYDTYPDRFQAPHNGRLNALFLDGHVETMTVPQLLAPDGLLTRWQGKNP